MATIKTKSMIEILQNKSEQILIPIYQRNYDWKSENVQRLLSDLFEFRKQYEENNDSIYFLGNMVYKKVGDLDDSLTKMVLVDGQQRITTTLLILAFIQNEMEVNCSDLLRVDENGEQKLKIAKMNNSSALQKIIEGKVKKLTEDEQETNYWQNYLAIKKWFSESSAKGSTIKNLLEKTVIAWVQLSKTENENKVFETINSTGEPLKSSDLIKNFIFFGALKFNHEQEEELTNLYIENVEKVFEESSEMDEFFRYFVAIKGDYDLPNKGSRDIYKMFMKYISDKQINLESFDDVKVLILDILKSALIYNEAEKEIKNIKTEKDSKLFFFKDIFLSNKNTYYGIFYSIFDYWFSMKENLRVNKREFELIGNESAPSTYDIYKTVARFIIYRSIAGKKDKNITRDAVKFFSHYKAERERCNSELSLGGFIYFMENREADEQKIPSSEQLLEHIKNEDAYKLSIKKTRNILIAYELGKGSSEAFNEFKLDWQVEHIMPQAWNEFWSKDLGLEKANDFSTKMNKLPNLTLLSKKLNPSIGNREYSYKKEKIIEDSRLLINNIFREYEKYDEVFIGQRAKDMWESIVNLFKK